MNHRARNAAKPLLGVFAALALLLAPAAQASTPSAPAHPAIQAGPNADNGNPTAAQLLAKVSGKCNQVSNGAYSNKIGQPGQFRFGLAAHRDPALVTCLFAARAA